MKHLRPLLLLCILALTIGSCKKDDKEDPKPEPTKTELLTAKTWKRSGLKVSPVLIVDSTSAGYVYKSDLYEYLGSSGGSCLNDNIKKFNSNGKFSFEQGATSCISGADQIYGSGTWNISTDETSLSLSLTYNSQKINLFDRWELFGTGSNYKITQLTATTLEYTYTLEFEDDPTVYTFTETLTAQ